MRDYRVTLRSALLFSQAGYIVFLIEYHLLASLLGVAGGEIIIPTLVFGYGAPIKVAGSLSLLISLPTVLAGVIRHWRAKAFTDASFVRAVIVPMGAGALTGSATGALLIAAAPASAIKVGLGLILICSAWKVFGHAVTARDKTPEAV